MAAKPLCSIPDCGKAAYCRGWCSAHYARWHRHGNPLAGNTSRGEATRFFEETVLAYDGDECLIWPFSRTPAGYGQLAHQGVHRMVCERTKGPPPTCRHQAAPAAA